MKVLKTLAVTAVLGLGACEQVEDVMTSPLTDERLASQAGGVLGINPNNLTVIERRSTMGSATFFSVRASNGRKYNCVITGGGLLALGMVNAPDCAPDGQPIQRRSPF